MNRQLPGGDATPWYRQGWPWFLILLPTCVVVASLYTVFLASQGADDLVVSDYYKDGLAINRRLEREQQAQALGLSPRLRFTDDTVRVTLTGLAAQPQLYLSLAHPLEADRDFAVTLARAASGEYVGTLAHAIAPHWHWTLEQQRNAGWRLEGTVRSEDIGDDGSD